MKRKASATMGTHDHVFLGEGHLAHERRTWAAIALTAFMMVAEIAGGMLFGSLAVVADGVHMATHALAFLLAALAYTYARRHAGDARFVFGTGKLGDLAGYTSAIILAMIATGIGYEAAIRLISPVTIHFEEAILVAAGGLGVNIATAWLLGGGGNRAAHEHPQAFGHTGTPPPHAPDEDIYEFDFAGHGHAGPLAAAGAFRDHNIRAAFVHVAADAAISVLAICGLLLGRVFGWVFMDPVMGIAGALVIANWAFGLMRDTGAVLLDMNPDKEMADELRRTIESDGDQLTDFHLWRLGPGHLAAIISVLTPKPRDAEFYRSLLSRFRALSHVTIEVRSAPAGQTPRAKPAANWVTQIRRLIQSRTGKAGA